MMYLVRKKEICTLDFRSIFGYFGLIMFLCVLFRANIVGFVSLSMVCIFRIMRYHGINNIIYTESIESVRI